MRLSRSAKRGIAILNRLQSRPHKQKYHTKMMEIRVAPPEMGSNIFNAAMAAAEAINASVQIVSNTKSNAITPDTEGRAELDVPGQSKDGAKAPEGTPGGPQ